MNKSWTNTSTMLELATQAREVAIEKIKRDYGGAYFDKLFLDANGTSRGRTMFHSINQTTDFSKLVFQSKLRKKILEVLVATNHPSCDCMNDEASLVAKQRIVSREGSSLVYPVPRRALDGNATTTTSETSTQQQPQEPHHLAKFVWTTAGHSVAAGHGNLFNETQTAVMERLVTDVFSVIGIDFEARNFGISAALSGPEFALCTENMYGNDVDVLTWDFAMTDLNDYWKLPFFVMRARLGKSHPVVLALRVANRPNSKEMQGRMEYLQMAETQSCPVMYLDPRAWLEMKENLPDMAMSNETNKLAPFVRDFVCGGMVESGKPTCGDLKFNDKTCPKRRHMVKWHPGWRTNAFYGNLLALFMMDSIVDVLQDMEYTNNGTDPVQALRQLQEAERNEFTGFQNSTQIPQVKFPSRKGNFQANVVLGSEPALWRRKSMCRTAVLPSQMRYLNLSMEEHLDVEEIAGTTAVDKNSSSRPHSQLMSLIASTDDRETCTDTKLRIDRADRFVVRNGQGWRSLTLPTDNAREFYGDVDDPAGIVIVCTSFCASWKCPNELTWDNFTGAAAQIDNNNNPGWSMRVNGQVATMNYDMPDGRGNPEYCSFLARGDITQGRPDALFFNATADGKFVVEAMVTAPSEAMLALSSVIVL